MSSCFQNVLSLFLGLPVVSTVSIPGDFCLKNVVPDSFCVSRIRYFVPDDFNLCSKYSVPGNFYDLHVSLELFRP